MNLLDTHIYKLRIRIANNASAKQKENWKKFKEKCESGDNRDIAEQIKEYCELESNKQLPYLDRMEGGLGGNNNLLHKQIRFRNNIYPHIKNDNDCVMCNICDSVVEKWTMEELDDLLFAFIQTSRDYTNFYVVGHIEMVNINLDEKLENC